MVKSAFFILFLFQVTAAQTPSTWNVIQRKVLDRQCISCHTAGTTFANQSGLVLTQDVAYQQLLNVRPKNAAALKDSLMRVSAHGSYLGVAKSFLWEKIDASQQSHFNNDHPYYGAIMPLGGNFLTKGELKLINEWIYAGAPQSGTVADTSVLLDTTRHSLPPFAPLPAPARGLQFHLGPFTVQPNAANDREFFIYQALNHAEDLFVNRTEITMRNGSHHFLFYTFNPSMPAGLMPEPNVIRDLRDTLTGFTNQWLFYQMFYHVFFAGTQTPYANYHFPKGVALRLPAKTGFDMNSHYVNRTGSVQVGEVYANLYTVPREEVERVAEVLNLANNAIELPPMQTTTLTKSFLFQEQRHVFQLFTHAHERLAEFSIEVIGGPNNGKTVYWTNDWQHPPILNFDPPLTLKPGEGLKAIAKYNNTTSNTIRFGLQSTDEMMIIFGAYYKGEVLSHSAHTTLPNSFRLEQNYPNPFNPTTVISYQLTARGLTSLIIYDALGREAATVVNEVKEAGRYSVLFKAVHLASGVYIAKLQSNGRMEMRKMILLK